jgi:glutamate synthase domain-containing protein 1
MSSCGPQPHDKVLAAGGSVARLAGDGAGILVGMPDGFFQAVLMEEQGLKLPPQGAYAVGQVFLPKDETQRQQVSQCNM